MEKEKDTSIVGWLRENIWNLLITVFLIGGAYSTIQVQNSYRDTTLTTVRVDLEKSTNRVEALEKQLIGVTLSQQNDHTNLTVLSSDSKQLQASVSKIEASVDVMTSKMDTVITELHRLSVKIDDPKH